MSEEESQRGGEGEPNPEELARRIIYKQKAITKAAAGETRTLTDADIMALMSQARVPASALLGHARSGGSGIYLGDYPPDATDGWIEGDWDAWDPLRSHDMDGTDG
jgi:hypothetical protein